MNRKTEVANRGEGAECDNLRRCDLSAEGKAIAVCRDWALWSTAIRTSMEKVPLSLKRQQQLQ